MSLAIFILIMFWPYLIGAALVAYVLDMYSTVTTLIKESKERRR